MMVVVMMMMMRLDGSRSFPAVSALQCSTIWNINQQHSLNRFEINFLLFFMGPSVVSTL